WRVPFFGVPGECARQAFPVILRRALSWRAPAPVFFATPGASSSFLSPSDVSTARIGEPTRAPREWSAARHVHRSLCRAPFPRRGRLAALHRGVLLWRRAALSARLLACLPDL